MDINGLRIPLDHLPVSFAGLEVFPLQRFVEAHPPVHAKVGVDLRVSEDDLALSPFQFTREKLAPAEFALSRAIDKNGRQHFVGVSFQASEGRLLVIAHWRHDA